MGTATKYIPVVDVDDKFDTLLDILCRKKISTIRELFRQLRSAGVLCVSILFPSSLFGVCSMDMLLHRLR